MHLVKKVEEAWAPKCVHRGCNAPARHQAPMVRGAWSDGGSNIHVWLCDWHQARALEGQGISIDGKHP